MADSSFDIVSKIDRQEADNALNQARKEVEQRYDFKGTDRPPSSGAARRSSSRRTPRSARNVLDVFQTKLIKRGISLKSLETGDPVAGGKEYRITSTLKEGISQGERRKKIGMIIRDEGPQEREVARSRATNCACSPSPATTCRRSSASSRPPTSTFDLQFTNYR